MKNKEKWNKYMREYKRKRRTTDKEYAARIREQNAASERRRRAAKDMEIEALKARIAELEQGHLD